MAESPYPFVDTFLEEKAGTLYVLSDSHIRLRDPLAIVCLSRFFAERGVRIDMRASLASRRRSFDDTDILIALGDDPGRRDEAERLLKDPGKSLDERVRGLFRIAEDTHGGRIDRKPESVSLEPRGPVLMLGRPELYPAALRQAIKDELSECGHRQEITGRFSFVSDPPTAGREESRSVIDAFSGLTVPYVPFFEAGQPAGPYIDYAVIRMVAGPFRHRTFLFVYGTSTLGTVAAAQAIIDPDHNEVFARLGVGSFLATQGCAEVLIRAERLGPFRDPWTSQFRPSQIRVVGKPVAPVSEQAQRWISRLTTATGGENEDLDGLYRCLGRDPHGKVTRFQAIGLHPPADGGGDEPSVRVSQMVGGSEIRDVTRTLLEIARTDQTRAILLIGPTGVGKELAARIIFEERALRLLRRLATGPTRSRPVVVSPRYVGINCATLVETLAEAQLFGIREGFATNVPGSRGAMLEAGEGVVLLDEIQCMAKDRQAKILRCVQPPYGVTPLGVAHSVPCSGVVVATSNEEPELLVSEGRLRADLYARLRPCTVRIPTLAQRPGDVPALLAHLAECPVRFDERVLRCLLADNHPQNVRGLFQYIARARRRRPHGSGDPAETHLEIRLEDLDPDLRSSFTDLYREIRDRQTDRPVFQQFQFEAPRSSPVLADLFDEAVVLLSSIEATTAGKVYAREHATDYDYLWPGEPARGAGSSAKGASGRRAAAPAWYGQRWLGLIERAVVTLGNGVSAPLDDALRQLGDLFKMRCPGRKKKDRAILDFFVQSFSSRSRGARVKQKHYAMSLGMPETTFCERLKTLGVAKPARDSQS